MSDHDKFTLPQIKIDRNVAWTFYGLKIGKSFNLQDYFVKEENTVLRADFVYPQPSSEKECMEWLEKTVKDHYDLDDETAPAKIRRIVNPGIGNAYCQFSGGGDIYIYIHKAARRVYSCS